MEQVVPLKGPIEIKELLENATLTYLAVDAWFIQDHKRHHYINHIESGASKGLLSVPGDRID